MGNKRAIVRFTIEEYNQWAHNVFATIEKSKLQATLVVNESLLTLYFLLGKEIVERQEVLGWGAQVVNLLSADLLRRYPKESGFSERNLKYMRQFAKEYPHFPFLQVPLAQLETNPIAWKSALNNSTDKKGFVQVPLAQITWYHHISLISRVKTKEDNPTIALLLCTNKKSKKVEYSLRGNQQPLGVASYHLSNALQEALQSALPTADEIRKKLEELQNESFD